MVTHMKIYSVTQRTLSFLSCPAVFHVNKSSQWNSALGAWIVLDFKWIPIFFIVVVKCL